jgi:transporter family-2 protein
MVWAYGAWAFAAGMLIPVMAALNGTFGRAISSPTWAAAVLFVVGLVATVPIALVSSGIGPLHALGRTRPEHFLGGLIVAFYVLSATVLTPRFGVGPTVLCVVVAQILTSAVIGQFGWLGAPRQPLDFWRVLGMALMLGGLVLAQPRRA